ncbi:MAG: sugar porter family MFS transporter [Verrucomicrobia bacterium]|jgi:sugar porter (SP) family MFS transporter|nr:sugar porter family MFS transporter [Verrucomicrobiota bacterium]OQC68051.1 MAG: D-xylose-proton symporter [Verrucomicrobia bacterium ADurb.Bin006]MDI9381641.1 sugar porter family MFS transporter [Verrucomicrobiota bacterium]NMD21037.1 sugar porter family MFS transporter [Verrucomicrobiota bacterium]HOA61018.1 sugar porter family MFS transporter [Verrucomicrobiota bacterium]
MITATTASGSNLEARLNTRYIWTICLVAALGGLLFGYDWVVIGGAAKFYEAFFQLKDTAQAVAAESGFWAKLRTNAISPVGWAQSCALLGCLVGAIVSGPLSDRFGRKPILILAAFNFVASSLGIAFAQSFPVFVTWRIMGGVSIGLASNISPLYISEIAPATQRGLLVAINQLTIVIGILAAQFVNWCIARPIPDGMAADAFAASWNVTRGWRWMFGACAVPSLLFFVSALFVPESPRWLCKAGTGRRAERVLSRIGGASYASAAMAEIQATLTSEDRRVRLGELLDRRVLVVLGLGIFLAVFQQWCGINVIFNYASEIFAQAGFNLNDALTNIVATGVVNLVFVFVALFTVDRLGRRPLMLFGAAGLALIYLAIGACYHIKGAGTPVPPILFLALVLAAIGTYSMSLAPVVWVLISEIFPNRVRGTAMSIAVGALWIACFLLTYTFPIFKTLLGVSYTFWIYAAICATGFAVLWLRLPETKGKSLEQIERELVDRSGREADS